MIAQVKNIGLKAALAYVLLVLGQPSAKSQNLARVAVTTKKVDMWKDVPRGKHTYDSTAQASSVYVASKAIQTQVIKSLPEKIVVNQFKGMKSAIAMPYNSRVKPFITYYTAKDREFVEKMLERKGVYFPIYEEALKRYGLPDELKYLSIVESHLNPKALSPVKAAGLWQFMSVTGKYYDLKQDAYVDERMDPYKATDAACRYLRDLHDMFGDWHLALAAYNCGPGNLRRAIRRSGNKKTFWQIYNFLPAETRAYVPKFIAVNYVMKYAQSYNITADPEISFVHADTVLTSQYVDMKQLAAKLSMPLEELQALNPQLKKSIVPAHYKNCYLRIPASRKEYFTLNRHYILASSAKSSTASNVKLNGATSFDAYRQKQLASIKSLDTLTIKMPSAQLPDTSWRVSQVYVYKSGEKIKKLNALKSISANLVKN